MPGKSKGILGAVRPASGFSKAEIHDRTRLFEKHMDLADLAAKSLFRQVKARDLELGDLRAMGHEALWKLVRRPGLERITNFRSYAKNTIFNYLRNRLRLSHARIEPPASFGIKKLRDEVREPRTVQDAVNALPEPPQLLVQKASFNPEEFRRQLYRGLTEKQCLIIKLYMAGRKHAEIAREVGIKENSVSEFITRRLEQLLAKQNRRDLFLSLLDEA